MTVESVIQPDKYDGDGATRDWAITFDVDPFSATNFELYLEEDGLSTLITTAYEIDLVTPKVVYPTVVSGLDVLTTAQQIIIKPVLDLKQEFIDVAVQGAIPLPSIEAGFDKVVLMLQQQQEEIDRSVKTDISSDDDPDDLIDSIAEAVIDCAASEVASAASAAASAASAAAAAISAAGVAAIVATFDDTDLTDGVLTVTHNFALSAPYILDFTIYNNLGLEVDVDNITGSANSHAIDLTSKGTLSGDWGYMYGAQASVEIASQAEAEAGTGNAKLMTPLRTKQAIDENVVITDQATAETGTNNTELMTPLRTKQAIDENVVLTDQSTAETGTNNTEIMTPLRTAQAITAQDTSKSLGAWVNKSGSVAGGTLASTLAATDLFVSAYMDSNSADATVIGYTDSSNPPTTVVAKAVLDRSSETVFACITFPVKSGDYYKLDFVGGSGTPVVRTIPLS